MRKLKKLKIKKKKAKLDLLTFFFFFFGCIITVGAACSYFQGNLKLDNMQKKRLAIKSH